MANFRSVGAFFSGNTNQGSNQNIRNDDDIVKKGILTKRKKMKNRYFVLRRETSKEQPSRLEYYDSEKKFLDGSQPKKKYILKECFSISRKSDARNNYMIALYINKDCIALVAQNEAEMQDWLQALQQHKHAGTDGSPRIEYEHVWQVEVQPRSLASSQNLAGDQWACLTNRLLSLVRRDNANNKKEFNLNTIRKCGHLNQFFYVELGRFSPIGCGILWMKTEDPFIAQNMHNIVANAMNHISSRERTHSVSDTQREVPAHLHPPRLRSDSMPASARGQTHKETNCTSEAHLSQSFKNEGDSSRCGTQVARPQSMYASYGISQSPPWLTSPFGSPGSSESLGSPLDDKHIDRHTTPDKEIADNAYVKMDRSSFDSISSPKGNKLRTPLGYGDQSEYVPMDVDTETKDSLGIHPPKTLMGLSPKFSHNYLGSSSGMGSASHSRSSSLAEDTCDGYTLMTAPAKSFSPNVPSYLEMGPGLAQEKRTVSTPIPVSPTDDSYHEMSPNSESSSFTSGTPSSDQRIHELINEKNQCGSRNTFSEEMDSLEPRPLRTSSVGSKPEQFKRKNRLDAVAVSEPARVRAFSVGSRVSMKFGMGRLGTSGNVQGTEPPVSGTGELFPSIKESCKQAKNKSSSAPMLGSSPVSHSWSGTPGSYFRGFIQNRNHHRETNLMELDFSKNKSYDFIPSEENKEKESKTSRERLWHTFTGCRQRSNSKSSAGSISKLSVEVSREKRASESDASGRGVEIPYLSSDRSDYFEIDFKPSPRNSTDHSKGYVPMHAPSPAFLSSFSSEHKNGIRHSSFSEPYTEMSSSLSSNASQDGYVDMTQCGSSGILTTVSSSSVPHHNVTFKPSTSQELPSPMDDFMDIETETVDSYRKGKKNTKRKSLKESAKKRKSESGAFVGKSMELESPEFPHKGKGALSTLTNLITRKSSSASKSPLSPGSPVTKSTSPFSSLSRSRSKESKVSRNLERKEEETNNYKVMVINPSGLSQSPPTLDKRKLSGSIDMASPLGVERGEEKMLFDPSETMKLLQKNKDGTELNRTAGAYMNMSFVKGNESGSLPSLNTYKKYIKPSLDFQNYVNMQPGTSSPQLSPPEKKENIFSKVDKQMTNISKGEENYVMMGVIDSKNLSLKSPDKEVAQYTTPSKPSNESKPPSLALEKLALSDKNSSNTAERSRSHSGPGAPEGATGDRSNKKKGEGRASSACSSPVSYSPPTSPALGSVSSLSEGGLSSASSTCTVINVDIQRQRHSSAKNTSQEQNVEHKGTKSNSENKMLQSSVDSSITQEEAENTTVSKTSHTSSKNNDDKLNCSENSQNKSDSAMKEISKILSGDSIYSSQ